MSTNVFVVSHGELNNGGSVVSIHNKRKDAIKAALAVKCCFDGGWEKIIGQPYTWGNGCDFVLVQKYKVEEGTKC